MKTKEELNALKAEVETLNKKLAELNEDELKLVTGGGMNPISGGGDLVKIGYDGLNIKDVKEKHAGQARLPTWDLIF